MTPIVFKMRHTDPRTKRRSTPQRNSSHIKYIGEREHALIAEKNTEHIRYIGEREHAALTQHNNGLFGKIRGEYSNSYATTDVQNYVRSMSTTHRNIYWSVYSFKPETAAEAGLHTLTDWENWVKQRIYEISDHLKIRYDDLEYIAAVHLKEGQPHVHIGFWDKEQQIYRKTVSPVICDRIRIDAIKHTFRDKFNELHNKEDRLIKKMRQQAALEISGGNEHYLIEIKRMLDVIRDKLPKRGQCSYQYMPEDIKKSLDAVTSYLINNSESIGSIYKDILDTRDMYNELLHNDESNWGHYQTELYIERLNDEILNKMGNTMLRTIVNERRIITEGEIKHDNDINTALNMAQAMTDLLRTLLERDDDRLIQLSKSVFGRGDMSKDAIREMIYRMGYSPDIER